MRSRLARGSLALAAVLIAPVASAQVIKTPPLTTSETFQFGISTHIPSAPPWAGWAGSIVRAHLLDNQELDVESFHSFYPVVGPGGTLPASVQFTNPLGPPSSNVQSVPISFTFWHPQAQISGIPVVPSQVIPLATLTIHAKNTTGNNSDIDASFARWNVWHIRPGATFASQLVPLDPSDRLWVSSGITNLGQLHTLNSFVQLPAGGPTPFSPTAHWLHVSNPITLHLTAGPGSAYYATAAGVVSVGIEHVPEPASALLVGGGILALALGGRARQRRLRMA